MTSEFNKEDALECLEIAKRAAGKGDVAKAERFGLKAKAICDCEEVQLFLKELLAKSSAPGPSTKGPSVRQRPARVKVEGTEEQRTLIAKIRKAKDYYETLDITQEATEDDIKKAYKKLALKLHPDKNKATGAEEAFKAVSRAFSCLSDPAKRQTYDRFGTEEQLPAPQSSGHRHEFYAEDIDAEQIFNMFFGGGFPMHGHHPMFSHLRTRPMRRRRQQDTPSENGSTQFSVSSLLSLLPLLLFFVITYLSGGSDQVFSLYKGYPFEQEMITERYEIVFYVRSKTKFDRSFPIGTRQRQQLESNVEELARRILQENCLEEKRRKKRIQSWRGKEAADKIELTSCFTLREKFSSGQSNKRRTVKS